jgi:hypothetical protein
MVGSVYGRIEAQDMEILNRRAEALNVEAADVLSYQVER